MAWQLFSSIGLDLGGTELALGLDGDSSCTPCRSFIAEHQCRTIRVCAQPQAHASGSFPFCSGIPNTVFDTAAVFAIRVVIVIANACHTADEYDRDK